MRRAWVLLPFLLPVWAQTALAPLKEHPLRLQAEAGLRAAQRSLEAQAPLLSLNLQGNYARFGYECTPESLCETLPETAQGLTVALVLTPFPFGDAEDGVRRARIALRRAELAYRRTLTALQAQAVAAYGRYQEALLAQAVAEKGLVLAQKTLEAAKARQATPREIREAELALKEAQNRLAEAQQGVALARQAAEGLVDLEASLPEIPPPQGRMPLRLEEARLGLAEAEVAYSAAQRNLLPTVQGSLSFYPNERDAVSLSLSSRTLQPTLAYTRQDPARSATPVPGVGRYRRTEEAQLSLSLTLSPALFAALDAAKAQVQAAQRALQAEKTQAQLQEATLRNALHNAEAALALARLREEAARQTLEEAKKRLDLGLESPLGVLQAELGLLQAELARLQAENTRRNRILELYQFYGEILPEVMP